MTSRACTLTITVQHHLGLVLRYSMETCPSAHQVHIHHQLPIHTWSVIPLSHPLPTPGKVQRPIRLQTCTSLGRGRKPVRPEETHAVTENVQTPHTQCQRSGSTGTVRVALLALPLCCPVYLAKITFKIHSGTSPS